MKWFQTERPLRCFQRKEEKVERKGEENNTTTQQCKDPKQNCNHCNINGHSEDK
jgi:hypothetical protein